MIITQKLGHLKKPTKEDAIYCYPPVSIRRVLKKVAIAAEKLIFVITIKDDITSDYINLVKGKPRQTFQKTKALRF